MPKVLVIPDVHLKPWMFERASRLMERADVAVVLGDLVDDWGRQGDRGAYAATIEAAMRFDARFPNTLWCVGNHDYCYLHFDEGTYNSGFSDGLKYLVRARLQELERAVGERCKVVHEVGGVLFSHAGVGASYVGRIRERLGDGLSLAECVEFTNEAAGPSALWQDDSPLWLRPSGSRPGVAGVVQVAGHTPVERPVEMGGILVADTFSTRSDGRPIGNRVFVIYDTEAGSYKEAFS